MKRFESFLNQPSVLYWYWYWYWYCTRSIAMRVSSPGRRIPRLLRPERLCYGCSYRRLFLAARAIMARLGKLSGSGSGWVRAFNRGLRNSHCRIRARPGLKYHPHKRLPERGGTLSVDRKQQARLVKSANSASMRRLARIAARSSRTPSTAIEHPFEVIVGVPCGHASAEHH